MPFDDLRKKLGYLDTDVESDDPQADAAAQGLKTLGRGLLNVIDEPNMQSRQFIDPRKQEPGLVSPLIDPIDFASGSVGGKVTGAMAGDAGAVLGNSIGAVGRDIKAVRNAMIQNAERNSQQSMYDKLFKNMPQKAAESAQTFESVGDDVLDRVAKQNAYKKLFGKQAEADDIISNTTGILKPGKSAEESAHVFSTALPEEQLATSLPKSTETQQDIYNRLFGKQSEVDSTIADKVGLNRSGKSAADSAEVFTKELPETLASKLSNTSEKAKLLTALGAASVPSALLANKLKASSDNEEVLPVSISKDLDVNASAPVQNKDFFSLFGGDDELWGGYGKGIPKIENSASKPEDDRAVTLNIPGVTGPDSTPVPINVPQSSEKETAPKPQVQQTKDLVSRFNKSKQVEQKPTDSNDVLNTLLGKKSDSESPFDKIQKLLGKQDAELKSAQEQRDTAQLGALLNAAGTTIGEAFTPLAKNKDDGKFTQQMLSAAEKPVKDIEQKQEMHRKSVQDSMQQNQLANEMAKEDPSSPISSFYRDLAKQDAKDAKMTLNTDGMSASNLEKIMPHLKERANRMIANESNRLKGEENRNYKQSKLNEAQRIEAGRIAERMGKTMSADIASSRTALGKAALGKQAAEKIEALISNYKNGDELDTSQLYELASAFDSMIKGGVSTVSGIEHLIPQNIRTDASKIKSYLQGQFASAGQGHFVKKLMLSVDTEKKVAAKQIKEYISKHRQEFGRLKQLDPEWYDDILREKGFYDYLPNESEKENTKSESSHSKSEASKQGGMIRVLNPKTGLIHTMSKEQAKKAVAAGGVEQ